MCSHLQTDRLETEVLSASNGTDVVDRHEVLRELYAEIVSILMRHRLRFSTALVMSSSLNIVRSDCGRPPFAYAASVTPHVSRRSCSIRRNPLASQ
jgi:hypothetical protein